ncbi:MAG: iron-sulfur cluster assembly accessory protein [Balneolaceae bacterium]|nr:MAG: iron-sulfur cluster assembly accessory protein [Balneolaceae bacterium]
MSMNEDNLDDVIASLIDDFEEAPSGSAASAPASEAEPEKPVELTERAARQVRKIREKESLGSELFLRVAVEGGGCSGLSYKLGFDIQTDEDVHYMSQDIQIVINPKHLLYLNGILIDYPDGLDARGFTFNNPNASESCGCGSSFAI